MQNVSATHEQVAHAWLEEVSMSARGRQLKVFAVRLVQLAAQISAFWFFTHLMQSIIVEHHPVSIDKIIPFIITACVWGLCAWFADSLAFNAKHALEGEIDAQVQDVLQREQIAITRKHSATFWQQLFLNHLSDVGDYLTQYSIQKWLAGIGPLVVLLVIFPVNFIVGLTLLLTMPVVPLFMILVGKGAASLHRKHFIALERFGDMFSDRLKGLALITATGQHQNQLVRLDNASKIVNRKTMSVVSLAFLSSTVLDFFSTVSIALVAVFIGFTMLGELSFGPEISLQQGLFMLLVAPLLFSDLRTLGRYYHQKAKALAGAERFAQVFRDAPASNSSNHCTDIAWLNFKVLEPTLKASQLVINRHDWIMLTGPSGSGKTVMLEALAGFRSASHSLPGDIALLSQQACVLDNTVAFNLHLGREGYADNELKQALEDVELTGWFSHLPNGLLTQMGDAPPLSGGEAQRLSLARALILKKEFVLLDEPTAHLTNEQHHNLARLIHEKLADISVIWASHKSLPKAWFNQQWHISEGEIKVSK